MQRSQAAEAWRLLFEGLLTRSLDHPNVIKVHAFACRLVRVHLGLRKACGASQICICVMCMLTAGWHLTID